MNEINFVFHSSYIENVPEEVAPEFCWKIIKYVIKNENPTFDDWRDLKIWELIKNRVDSDLEKYNKKINALRNHNEKKRKEREEKRNDNDTNTIRERNDNDTNSKSISISISKSISKSISTENESQDSISESVPDTEEKNIDYKMKTIFGEAYLYAPSQCIVCQSKMHEPFLTNKNKIYAQCSMRDVGCNGWYFYDIQKKTWCVGEGSGKK